MVGVPGRSKACHNCRQRRIRCGHELPVCKNCISSGRTCTGYQRKYAFVLAKQMSSGTGHSTGHQLANVRDTESGLVLCSRWGVKPPSPAAARTSAASLSWSSSKATRASVDAAEQARRRKATCFPSCLIPNRLLHDGLFSLFLQSDTSHDQSIHLVFGERQDWIRQIIDLPNLQPVLRDGVLAVCTARLGRHVSRPDLVYESRRLYTKTLSGMQRGLLDVSMRQNVEVLAASLALLLYEVTECPGKSTDGYRAHYLGMMNLLRLRGPVAHKSGLAHSVFQVLRLHAMFQGFTDLDKTFLSEPEWCRGPWSDKPEDKPIFDLLLDILLDVPTLAAQRRAVEDVNDPMMLASRCLHAVDVGWEMEARLETWFRCFRTIVPGPLYIPELRGPGAFIDEEDREALFSVSFRFPTFAIGQNPIYYWVALMSIHAHLCFTYEMLARLASRLDSVGRGGIPCLCGGQLITSGRASQPCLRHFKQALLPSLGHRKKWYHDTAFKICQSTDYFLRDDLGGFGPTSMLPALAIVRGHWRYAPGDWTREMKWVETILRRIQASGGIIAGSIV